MYKQRAYVVKVENAAHVPYFVFGVGENNKPRVIDRFDDKRHADSVARRLNKVYNREGRYLEQSES